MIEKGGIGIIVASLIFSIPGYFIHPALSLLFLFFACFTAYFFRDPERKIGDGVVSPADGRIDFIEGRRLEIFMSPFDCHINRAPYGGKVAKVRFVEGSTPPAFIRKQGVRTNEIVIETEFGTFKVLQIAGIFARRIVSYVREGEWVQKGQKIGMIRFGSRVVLEVPEGFRFVRRVGEKVKAGETVALRDEDFQRSELG